MFEFDVAVGGVEFGLGGFADGCLVACLAGEAFEVFGAFGGVEDTGGGGPPDEGHLAGLEGGDAFELFGVDGFAFLAS